MKPLLRFLKTKASKACKMSRTETTTQQGKRFEVCSLTSNHSLLNLFPSQIQKTSWHGTSNEGDAPSAFLPPWLRVHRKQETLPSGSVPSLPFSVRSQISKTHQRGTLWIQTFKSHLAQLSKVRERESFASEPSSSSSCISERMDGRHSSYLSLSKDIWHIRSASSVFSFFRWVNLTERETNSNVKKGTEKKFKTMLFTSHTPRRLRVLLGIRIVVVCVFR